MRAISAIMAEPAAAFPLCMTENEHSSLRPAGRDGFGQPFRAGEFDRAGMESPQ